MVGGLYRRIRPDADGKRIQRAEVRFDDVAGCLRVPAGGSSRQTIVIVEGALVRSRLLSPREAARLMGLSDDYLLRNNCNDAYGLMGDGVAVPVVRFLAAHILEPVLQASTTVGRADRQEEPSHDHSLSNEGSKQTSLDTLPNLDDHRFEDWV